MLAPAGLCSVSSAASPRVGVVRLLERWVACAVHSHAGARSFTASERLVLGFPTAHAPEQLFGALALNLNVRFYRTHPWDSHPHGTHKKETTLLGVVPQIPVILGFFLRNTAQLCFWNVLKCQPGSRGWAPPFRIKVSIPALSVGVCWGLQSGGGTGERARVGPARPARR